MGYEASSPAERYLERSKIDTAPVGRLSTAALQRERTLEAYLRAGVLPRFMARLREIDAGALAHQRELARAHRALRQAHAGDPAAFAAAWRARVARWSFQEHNVLVRQHNDWYPIERQLPIDPRTGEYVAIAGRSYRREELDAAWALRQFPAE